MAIGMSTLIHVPIVMMSTLFSVMIMLQETTATITIHINKPLITVVEKPIEIHHPKPTMKRIINRRTRGIHHERRIVKMIIMRVGDDGRIVILVVLEERRNCIEIMMM